LNLIKDNPQMKLIIFGATGGTGQEIVRQALENGHDVTVLVRAPAKLTIQHDRLKVIVGDIGDAAAVEKAVAGADAVISALGPTRDSAPMMLTHGSANLIAAMKRHNVRRLIWQTGAGVVDEGDAPSTIRNIIIGLMKIISPRVLADSINTFNNIKHSDLDWTIVRVPMLKNGPRQGNYSAGFTPPAPKPLARADAAEFMLKQIDDKTFLRQSPMLGRR
jgi:putative NADH-flavin reductase